MSEAVWLEAEDESAAVEQLHALGCTDGLPVVVPTVPGTRPESALAKVLCQFFELLHLFLAEHRSQLLDRIGVDKLHLRASFFPGRHHDFHPFRTRRAKDFFDLLGLISIQPKVFGQPVNRRTSAFEAIAVATRMSQGCSGYQEPE